MSRARSVEPRHVVVAGAAGTLGKALVLELVAWDVVFSLCDVDSESLEELSGLPELEGRVLQMTSLDVRDADAVDDFVREADERMPIDWLISAVGVTEEEPVEVFERDESIFDVNYFGCANLVLSAARTMMPRKRGHLVVVSSLSSFFGYFSIPQYAASKAALRVWLQSIGFWTRRNGVGVTVACPGFFLSQMTSGGNLGPFHVPPEKVAKRILTGARRGACSVVFPWRLRLSIFLLGCLPISTQDWILGRVFRAKLDPVEDRGSVCEGEEVVKP